MRMVIGMVAAALVFGAGVVLADDAGSTAVKAEGKACCAAGGCGGTGISNLVAKLNLTEDQAKKVNEICAKRHQAESAGTGTSTCTAEVEKILTPEQAAKFKEMGGCKGCQVGKTDEPKKKE